MAGVVAWSTGCGQTEVPDIFANVQDALCFIDNDIKCKHGREFIKHVDFDGKCRNWLDGEFQGLSKLPKFLIRKSVIQKKIKGIHSLVESCVTPLPEFQLTDANRFSDLKDKSSRLIV